MLTLSACQATVGAQLQPLSTYIQLKLIDEKSSNLPWTGINP